VGGTIPPEDADALRGLGVAAVFTPGAPMAEVVSFLEDALAAHAS
jgi:methylmalonyl-CoA mutase C-terminal domain/subunit